MKILYATSQPQRVINRVFVLLDSGSQTKQVSTFRQALLKSFLFNLQKIPGLKSAFIKMKE
jgi:hypothetical protein